jgi:hypothetical protein
MMKDSNVRVTALKDGSVVNANANGNLGYVRVEQERYFCNKKGFLKKAVVSALMLGEHKILESIGFFNGQELQGKIVIKESLDPFNLQNPDKDYKYAGTTNIVCCQDGQPIYRRAFYNMDGTDTDEYVVHNNFDAIRNATSHLTEKEQEEATESFAL